MKHPLVFFLVIIAFFSVSLRAPVNAADAQTENAQPVASEKAESAKKIEETPATTAPATTTSSQDITQTMTYDVYAGGIHALDAKLVITTKDKSYSVKLESATHGLLKTLAPWSGNFSVTGTIGKDNALFPNEYVSSSTWKKETEKKVFTYNGKGEFLDYKVTETKDGKTKDKTPKKINMDLAKGTTDLLSATMVLLMNAPQTNDCSEESLIFDGDRNFKLLFKETEHTTLTKSRYNIYDGAALSCQVEVIPESGKWRKKPRGWLSIQEQGRKKGSLPLLWIGQMKDAPYDIPVKIRVNTNYGALFLHLTSYKTAKPEEKTPENAD